MTAFEQIDEIEGQVAIGNNLKVEGKFSEITAIPFLLRAFHVMTALCIDLMDETKVGEFADAEETSEEAVVRLFEDRMAAGEKDKA